MNVASTLSNFNMCMRNKVRNPRQFLCLPDDYSLCFSCLIACLYTYLRCLLVFERLGKVKKVKVPGAKPVLSRIGMRLVARYIGMMSDGRSFDHCQLSNFLLSLFAFLFFFSCFFFVVFFLHLWFWTSSLYTVPLNCFHSLVWVLINAASSAYVHLCEVVVELDERVSIASSYRFFLHAILTLIRLVLPLCLYSLWSSQNFAMGRTHDGVQALVTFDGS